MAEQHCGAHLWEAYINGLVPDSSIATALAMEIRQSSNKASICPVGA